MALITCPECGKEISDKAIACPGCGCPSSEWTNNEVNKTTLKAGEIIELGSYPQTNINKKLPIFWKVLKVENEKALLVSFKGLDYQPFNTSKVDGNNWDSSILYAWLNNEFKENAFSTQDCEKILEPITLLTIEEVKEFFPTKEERICSATNCTSNLGAFTKQNNECIWWLSSPGHSDYDASYVSTNGSVNARGCRVDKIQVIRPAIWIKL